MRKPAFFIVAALAVLAGVPSAVWGQFGSPTSSSGMFGSRTMGRAMGGASRSFGGSGMGGGLGSGMGMGSGSGLGSGMGLGTGTGMNSFGTSQFRFATRQPGEFVGADSRDINPAILGGLTGASTSASGGSYAAGSTGTSPFGTSQYGTSQYGTSRYGSSQYGTSQYGSRRGGGSSYRGRSSSGAYGSGANAGQVSVGLDAAFDVNVLPEAILSSAVRQRLVKSMRLPAAAPVEVSVQGGTAVLKGAVATPHDRALAEQLVLLEPGIVRVANELQVASTGATVGKPPQTPAARPPR